MLCYMPSNGKGHFHPVQVTKAIEKETGRRKCAELLSNRRISISAVNKKRQEWILKISNLVGEKIKVHVPGMATKLRRSEERDTRWKNDRGKKTQN